MARTRATEQAWRDSEVEPGVVGVPDCDVNAAGTHVEASSTHRVTIHNHTSDPRTFRVSYSHRLQWRHNDLENWADGVNATVFDDITVNANETWDAPKIKLEEGLDRIRNTRVPKLDNHFYLVSCYTNVNPQEVEDGLDIQSHDHTAECVT